jgi:hypothetical protein
MYNCKCCETVPTTVGKHTKYGVLYRCNCCQHYFVLQSNRLWEDVASIEGVDHAYSKVFYGAGEMGLANAVVCGCSINKDILDVDLNGRIRQGARDGYPIS